MDIQPVLENEIISLRPLQAGDFPVLFTIAADPLIWELHPQPDRFKPEVFQKYLDSAIASKGALVVIDKSTGNCIGCSRYYDYDDLRSSIVIGYTFLVRSHWGGTYNRSLKKLMMDHAFRFVKTIYFFIGEKNYRSQAAILKTGAKRTDLTGKDGFLYKVEAMDYLL